MKIEIVICDKNINSYMNDHAVILL